MAVVKKIVIFSLFYFCEGCTSIFADKSSLKNTMSHLQKGIILFGIVSLLLSNTVAAFTSADDSKPSGSADLEQEMTDLKNKVVYLEKKMGQNENQENNLFQSFLSGIKLTGGISTGYFYA